MTFARKGTDSYRDSGLAQPKGGAGWDEGVYVGVVNLTAPLFTHEVLPSHQTEWAENGEAPLSAGGPRAEHGDRIKGWSEEANSSGGTDGGYPTSRIMMLGWKLQIGELTFRGDGSVRDTCTRVRGFSRRQGFWLRIKSHCRQVRLWEPWLSLYRPSKPGRGNHRPIAVWLCPLGHMISSAPFHRWWSNG